MMEAVGNPTATPVSTSTSAPTASLTPSTIPTLTPNPFRIETTSTQGAAMYIERRIDFGQMAIVGVLSGLFGLVVIAFAYSFWQRSQNAGP